jgi:hypothetical protein
LYSRLVLHDLGVTGAGIPIQPLPTTHFIIFTYVLVISCGFFSPPYSQPSGRSSSSARQQYISVYPSSHGRAPPGRISSPSRGSDDNVGVSLTQPRFLQWARKNPFSNMRNSRIDEGIELQDRRTDVVDVPLGQARPVSPFFLSRRSTLYIM